MLLTREINITYQKFTCHLLDGKMFFLYVFTLCETTGFHLKYIKIQLITTCSVCLVAVSITMTSNFPDSLQNSLDITRVIYWTPTIS